jgi:hypothetical protein
MCPNSKWLWIDERILAISSSIAGIIVGMVKKSVAMWFMKKWK